MEQENKSLSLIERMKKKAESQQRYGGETVSREANMGVTACPNCGAGRAKNDGVTKCAYCGHEFIAVELSDGLNIKKNDNSR
jgi:uncharacterized Zn finger protein (UPF0148 family)